MGEFGRRRTIPVCRTYDTTGSVRVYAFKYMKIRRRGPKGVCQFEICSRGRKQVPHLFFTCPHCGEINRFYISLKMLQYHLANSTTIRTCHNCLFCRIQIPFGIDLPGKQVLKKYLAVAKQAAV